MADERPTVQVRQLAPGARGGGGPMSPAQWAAALRRRDDLLAKARHLFDQAADLQARLDSSATIAVISADNYRGAARRAEPE